MSDTVKLIIEIPKRDYEEIKKVGVFTFPHVSKAIKEATPLDDVKVEIKRMEYHMIDCEVLVSQEEVLNIIDNAGKGE